MSKMIPQVISKVMWLKFLALAEDLFDSEVICQAERAHCLTENLSFHSFSLKIFWSPHLTFLVIEQKSNHMRDLNPSNEKFYRPFRYRMWWQRPELYTIWLLCTKDGPVGCDLGQILNWLLYGWLILWSNCSATKSLGLIHCFFFIKKRNENSYLLQIVFSDNLVVIHCTENAQKVHYNSLYFSTNQTASVSLRGVSSRDWMALDSCVAPVTF